MIPRASALSLSLSLSLFLSLGNGLQFGSFRTLKNRGVPARLHVAHVSKPRKLRISRVGITVVHALEANIRNRQSGCRRCAASEIFAKQRGELLIQCILPRISGAC